MMDRAELDRILAGTTASVPQVADALDYSAKRTYEAIRNGTIPSIRLGKRKVRVPTSWLASQLNPAAVAA
jgi:excisionase family DNA binding protein